MEFFLPWCGMAILFLLLQPIPPPTHTHTPLREIAPVEGCSGRELLEDNLFYLLKLEFLSSVPLAELEDLLMQQEVQTYQHFSR
jgi:hypothetical protein